ncbi:MAG TPA: SDR family oxidoreductase [Thermodesulfobacteriota bacterium]|nr:SDR family oxidoreductase [Deltaproteobacteria bacterium]HNU70199.1 SDR family oxidoreductase [Thermodesulfobacteriota bacterium]
MELLEDAVVIVTGGTVGIGYATCKALAAAGAHVVAVGRNQEKLATLVAEIDRMETGARALTLGLNVRDEKDMEEMARVTMDTFGRIDGLIASAGILRAGEGRLSKFQQMTVAEWDDVIDTNLRGVFLANRAVLPVMINQRSGDIINLSSTSGRKGLAYDSAYCASKFGVIGLSEALAEEARQYGVRVQVLLPGAIDTGMWDQNGPLPPPAAILPVDRVATMIVRMLRLPDDVILAGPIIEPFKGWEGYYPKRTDRR